MLLLITVSLLVFKDVVSIKRTSRSPFTLIIALSILRIVLEVSTALDGYRNSCHVRFKAVSDIN